MLKETKTVKVKITNSHGLGYAQDGEYDVTPEEAKKLIEANKAVPVVEPKVENAKAKMTKTEKR